ncbi:hypothetical protein ACHAWF_017518 [Thalassiosira exigua]
MGNANERRRRRGKRVGITSGNNLHHDKNDESSKKGYKYKPHATVLVQFTEETPTWYDCGRNTAGRDEIIDIKKSQRASTNTHEIISKYRQLADEIYSHEAALSRQSAGGASYTEKDEKWVENTMKRGTLKDRVAAMSVVVGMDCMHKLYALDMLLDLAGCGVGGAEMGSVPNSRVGQMASEALSDLFVNTLLPKDRKLVSLENRPLYLYEGDRTLSPRVLLLWRYEEMIKLRYASYLSRYLARTLAGEDEPSKKNALTTASTLLLQIPEGEEVLLTMIVNKVGDPARKIASASGHQLRLILEEHPAMVNVVAREVQQLAHRPHLSPRALYNCVVFLNQLQLSRDDEDHDNASTTENGKPLSLPASLINTYFHLFEMTLKKEEGKKKGPKPSSGLKTRLLSALLTGVNRAHPYLPKSDAAMEQHVDSLYRISHTAPPAAATQALMLLFQLAVGSGSEEASPVKSDDETVVARKDRFYRALYSKLIDGEMYAGRQVTLFFNLVYKAMKYDSSMERVSAFSKRFLHTVLHLSSSIICGALFLLSEVQRSHPELKHDVKAITSEVLFDPTKREPRAAFSGKVASNTNLWELSLLTHHFHPSVSKFAVDSGHILYRGDPLNDFALKMFLDKFAFRNPKSQDKWLKQQKRGESIAERRSGLGGNVALPMNDPSYLQVNNVSEEEKFFHHFFVERAKRDEIKGIVRGSGANRDKDESDIEDEALNAAEADAVLDDFGGDTDSEEEAFVNKLAEKFMESAGNGKANFDEEDPDMDDWGDFGDSDSNNGEVDEEENAVGSNLEQGGNEDDFMDAASSEDEGMDDALGALEADRGISDDDADLTGETTHNKSHKNKREVPAPSIYADAEDYEKLLSDKAKQNGHEKSHEYGLSRKKKRNKKAT